MSQRSRRFQASQEAQVLPSALDHDDTPAMVPSLREVADGAGDSDRRGRSYNDDARDDDSYDDDSHQDDAQDDALGDTDEAMNQVEEQGAGFLTTARQQIASLTGKLVEWSKDHPVKMAASAAVFIAASALLVRVMQKKGGKIRAGAKQLKKRVKSGVEEAMSAVESTVRTGGRRSSGSRQARGNGRGRGGGNSGGSKRR